MHGRGVPVSGYQDPIATRAHLLVKVGGLWHVPGVLEQDDVSGVEADGPVAGVLVENVVDQVNDGCIIVMGYAYEPNAHQAGMSGLHVVHDD